jgi:hypothetical protein
MAIMALMMDPVSIFETSFNIYHTTRSNIPDDSHLHTSRHEKLKSHQIIPMTMLQAVDALTP